MYFNCTLTLEIIWGYSFYLMVLFLFEGILFLFEGTLFSSVLSSGDGRVGTLKKIICVPKLEYPLEYPQKSVPLNVYFLYQFTKRVPPR